MKSTYFGQTCLKSKKNLSFYTHTRKKGNKTSTKELESLEYKNEINSSVFLIIYFLKKNQ